MLPILLTLLALLGLSGAPGSGIAADLQQVRIAYVHTPEKGRITLSGEVEDTLDIDTTLIEVQGTGHTLDTPGERPSAEELTAKVVDFFTETLK